MLDRSKQLVVVLSRNYPTGLSVIRSLGAVGYTIDLVASAFKEGRSILAASSKYVRNSVEIVAPKVKDGNDTKLLEALLAYEGQKDPKPVLFPTDDYTASIMDQNRDRLRDIFIMPTTEGDKQGEMTRLMGKTVQASMAREAGIHNPKEWLISLEDEIAIPDDIVYPCFVKPLESITGYKREMKVCEDKFNLEDHLGRLKKRFENRSILVQEFLTIDYEIDFSGVAFDQDIIIPAIIKKTNVAQYEKGVTLAGNVVPFEELEELEEGLCEKVISMMQAFHYTGMFDMELNVVGGKVYFNEVNLRSGGPNFSYFMSGVNLPALFVDEMIGLGHTEEDEKVTEYGKSFIYDEVAWNDYIHGYMTKKELDQSLEKADIKLLMNDEDPVPGEIFSKRIKNEAIKYKVKSKIKGAIRGTKKTARPAVDATKAKLLRYPQTQKGNERDEESDKPRVLVSGRNYCSNLCMARSLGEAGYEVEVLRIFQTKPRKRQLMKMLKPDAYSKYIKAYHVLISRRRSKRIRNKLIELADPNRKMLLIPADDLVTYVADTYYEQLSQYYIIQNVNNTPDAINRLTNKDVQKELAAKAGLPVLNSCVIRTEEGKFTIPDTVTYPCFIKPNISKNSSKGRMKKCNSKKELRDTLTEYSQNKDVEFLVEDFVDIKKEYSILGISTKNGAIGPGFFVAEDGGQLEHRGVAITGRILPCSTMQPLIDDIVKFMGTLGFDGLYDVDLIETMDGKVYFVEINMRYGASGYAVTKCGANLPAMYADYMLFGKPIDMNCQVKETGKTFVSEKVLIEEYLFGRIPYSMVEDCMNKVDIHFIKNEEDPQAYEHFKKFFPVAKSLRQVNKIRARLADDGDSE